MRVRVVHDTRYDYAGSARQVIQVLRLTPRGHDGQHVVDWRVEVDGDGRLDAGEDALGNAIHTLWLAGPVPRVSIRASGEVETWDTGGVVRGGVERFPPQVFLRETALTRPDAAILDLARRANGAAAGWIAQLHALLTTLHDEMAFDTGATDVATSAAEAFAKGCGVCQDLAHVFIAAARTMGAPARYVSGHLARSDGATDQPASHAWAEAYVEDLGWVGFDPVNGVCPADRHVRVAVGLDYLGASPVRGSRFGGGAEHLEVASRVTVA